MQTVDFGESGPIRCSSCKAYMNPHMQFLDRGRKFKCCFCGGLTATPVDYICNTGVDGRRHDANDRPELSRGSVDFIATQEYMVSTASHPLFVDCSTWCSRHWVWPSSSETEMSLWTTKHGALATDAGPQPFGSDTCTLSACRAFAALVLYPGHYPDSQCLKGKAHAVKRGSIEAHDVHKFALQAVLVSSATQACSCL